MSREFQREDRYIVIKRKDLEKLQGPTVDQFRRFMPKVITRMPHRRFLVIESDWPEYDPAWAMIEARVTGADPVPPAAEMVGGVDFGIDERSVRVSQEAYSIFLAREQASKDRIAALQQRLTVADQRADDLESKAKLYDQLQRGAELLPQDWMITVEVERDGGGVRLIDPKGNDLDYPSNRESMGDEVEDAIEEALSQQANP